MLERFYFKNILNIAILSSLAWLNGFDLKFSSNIALADSKPKIVASHNILCDLVDTIAEDTVDLTCLIDSNEDPRTYSPTPSQVEAMEEAQLILYGGYQLESQIISLIESTEIAAPKLAVYEQVVMDPIQVEHKENPEEDDKKETANATETKMKPDPYVWHNVENVVAMVELIQPILFQLNPQEAGTYLQNTSTFIDRLWQVDAWIDEQIATIPEGKRILVTNHNSLNYYAQAYPLEEYKSLKGLNNQSSPTASQLQDLATEIKQTEVSTIFTETTTSDRILNNVATDAGVKLASEKLITHGLGQAENYLEMMSLNTCIIVNGLEGKCNKFK